MKEYTCKSAVREFVTMKEIDEVHAPDGDDSLTSNYTGAYAGFFRGGGGAQL